MISATQHARLHSSQTATAKKVYDARPIAEAWDARKIATELRRKGCNIDFRYIEGALAHLVEAGLLKEPHKGEFVRVPMKPELVRAELEDVSEQPRPQAAEQIQVMQKIDPLTRLAAAAGQLRRLAEEIETAALDAQREIEAAGAGSQKLRQLQALLKDLA